MIGLLFYFKTEDTYEQNLFRALAAQTRSLSNGDSTEVLLNGLNLVHTLVQPRQGIFSEIAGFKAGLFQPVTVDLMSGRGDCGSYSLVFARLLQTLGYDVRIAQMKVGDVYGGHIFTEVKQNGKWIVADPLYNLTFRNSNMQLASFDEIQNNWDFYKEQVPQNYTMDYSYDGVRYTNWDKIPVLMPAVKKTLNLLLGTEKADGFSFRMLMIRKNKFFFNITFFLLNVLVIYTILVIRKINLKAVVLQKEVRSGTVKVLKPLGKPVENVE